MTENNQRHRWGVVAAVAFAVILVPALYFGLSRGVVRVIAPKPSPFASIDRSAAPVFVGADSCRSCHPGEYDAWMGSHHELAMQPATPATMLGDFSDATLERDGVATRFFRRGDEFDVNTQGVDGGMHDYRAAYTFGITPLQQYLLDVGGGRYQAFTIAWDARPADQGGQRWFDLYSDEHTPPGDELHWAAPNHTWNFACAECHSTDLRKGYDAATDTYATTWAEVSVSCEACHGPGSRHVEIERIVEARGAGAKDGYPADHGLITTLTGPGAWKLEQGAATAWLTAPNRGDSEIESCGRCHSRRTQIAPEYHYGAPLSETHRVQLLNDPMYFPDGQIRDEVFVYGSFRQSLMYAKGVTCSDCHDPHTLKLRASGNAVCAQCHAPDQYDTPKHHFHEMGTPGASCVECHMPTRTYMVVDPRRDHSMRIPRPDLSSSLGVPNACNQCHADKTAEWSVEALDGWYGKDRRPGHQTYAHAFAAARANDPDATLQLEQVALDPETPAIARATALSELEGRLRPESIDAVRAGLADTDPLVRRAAIEALASVDPQSRWGLVSPLLTDPVFGVRFAAGEVLSDFRSADVDEAHRGALESVFKEYVASQKLNADRAEHWVALAGFRFNQGDIADAERCFREALRRDPRFVPAYGNLADMYRALGRESDAERALRDGIAKCPNAAALHHALGLALVRAKRTDAALDELRRAFELAPEDPRYGYVLGVAEHSVGREADAIATWRAVLSRDPNHADTIRALQSVGIRVDPGADSGR